jgi:hypothetical protein
VAEQAQTGIVLLVVLLITHILLLFSDAILRIIGRQGAAILVRVMGIIETHSLPTLTRSYPRRFTFYVAAPVSSILASLAVEIVLTTLEVAGAPSSLIAISLRPMRVVRNVSAPTQITPS